MSDDPQREPGEVTISVTTLFGVRLKQPFVDVSFVDKEKGTTRYQISPNEARRVGMLLLECAEASDQDANVYRFFSGLGLEEGQIAKMLGEFRRLRAARDEATEDPFRRTS